MPLRGHGAKRAAFYPSQDQTAFQELKPGLSRYGSSKPQQDSMHKDDQMYPRCPEPTQNPKTSLLTPFHSRQREATDVMRIQNSLYTVHRVQIGVNALPVKLDRLQETFKCSKAANIWFYLHCNQATIQWGLSNVRILTATLWEQRFSVGHEAACFFPPGCFGQMQNSWNVNHFDDYYYYLKPSLQAVHLSASRKHFQQFSWHFWQRLWPGKKENVTWRSHRQLKTGRLHKH